MEIQKILVPVDFSEHSKRALVVGADFASRFGAELHLLHVIADSVVLSPPYAPALPADYGLEVERAARAHFLRWCDENVPEDAEIHDHMRRGAPSHEILALAGELAFGGIENLVAAQRKRSSTSAGWLSASLALVTVGVTIVFQDGPVLWPVLAASVYALCSILVAMTAFRTDADLFDEGMN